MVFTSLRKTYENTRENGEKEAGGRGLRVCFVTKGVTPDSGKTDLPTTEGEKTTNA
jgi:hypothetical protein